MNAPTLPNTIGRLVAVDLELQAVTEPGRRLVEIAEKHAADFATRAEAHDRLGDFPHENFAALKESGFLAAPVPAELGGGGVSSPHDLMVAMSRLGRGDGSTAIAANMHIDGMWLTSRLWADAGRTGNAARREALGGVLRAVAAGRLVACGPWTEPGTMLNAPLAEAKRVDGGWVLNGRKAFATNVPAADILSVNARFTDENGARRFAAFLVPKANPGLQVVENWDALGMRASGSHDILLRDCAVPDAAVRLSSRWGRWDTASFTVLGVGIAHLAGVFLGIAEAARELAIDMVTTRRKEPWGTVLAERPAVQHVVAEMEMELAAARAVIDRAFGAADDYFGSHTHSEVTMPELQEVGRELQIAKQFVTAKAVEIVDRAMTLTGGAGYLSAHPLSRLYRDVRAGPFMQPYSPLEGLEYIGRATVGLDPEGCPAS